MLARAASRSMVSTKSRCSTSRMNVIASPLFWQPKQNQTPLLGVHRERRRLLGVERAQTREAAADTLQRDVLADQRDDVGGFPDPLHVLVEDAHPRLQTTRARQTPRRGRSSGRQPRSSTPRPSAYRSVIPLT